MSTNNNSDNNSDNPELIKTIRKGLQYFKEKDYLNAIIWFSKALVFEGKFPEKSPRNAVYQHRAYAWSERGEFEIAIMDINDAIRLSPMNGEHYCGRGKIHCELGLYAKAVRDFSLAIEFDSQNAEFFYHRSIAYSKIGEWKTALDDITKAIHFEGDTTLSGNPEYLLQQAEVFLQSGDYQKGLKGCREVQKKYENTQEKELLARSYHVEAKIRFKQENYDEAFQLFSKVKLYDPTFFEDELSLAKIYFQRKEYKSVISACSSYLVRFPNSFEAYGFLAESQLKIGEYENAKKSADQALALNPDYVFALRTRAQLYREKKAVFRNYHLAEQDEKRANTIEKKRKVNKTSTTDEHLGELL